MAGPVLEAFIKLFADDTRLKQQMGALKVEAEKAGADIRRAFTTGSARGAAPAQGELFGGAAGPRGPEMQQLSSSRPRSRTSKRSASPSTSSARRSGAGRKSRRTTGSACAMPPAR